MLGRQIFHLVWFVGAVAVIGAMIPRAERRRLLVASLTPFLVATGLSAALGRYARTRSPPDATTGTA
jgi:hypothetical protein